MTEHLIFTMFQKDYIPTWITLFLAFGIMTGYYFSIPLAGMLLLSGVLFNILIIYAVYSRKKLIPTTGFFWITMLLFVFTGITTINLLKNNHNNLAVPNTQHQLIFHIEKILKGNSYYQNYEARILKIDGLKSKERILLSIRKDSLKTQTSDVDDIYYTSAVLKEIHPPLNPYQFNYKNYLRSKQINYRLKLKPGTFLKLDIRKHTLKGLSYRIRKRIDRSLEKYNFSSEQLSIINALLLGQRRDIDKELYENYKNAGAVHILAISGLHVGIILILLNFLLKPIEFIKNGKLIKLILVVFLLWSFAFLAGLSASVVRAVTMFTAIAIGLYSRRKIAMINALILSMFFLLIFRPFYLFDAGFQLSYLAVFFIITLQPRLVKLWQPKSKIIFYFWQLLTVSISAQLGVLPLSLYYFHQFPGLFFVSSMVIIPFLGLILGIGFIVIILTVLNILPFLVADIFGGLINIMNQFINFISRQEIFIFHDIPFSLLLMLLFYMTFFLGLHLISNKIFKNIILFLTGIILLQSGLFYQKKKIQKSSEFIVFDQYKKTMIGLRNGENLIIWRDIQKDQTGQNQVLKDYKTGAEIKNNQEINILQNFYLIDKERILVIDSTDIYLKKFDPSIVILCRNPKINLERMIRDLKPGIIITDHTIFPDLADRWQQTCKKYNIVFYRTPLQGAFRHRY